MVGAVGDLLLEANLVYSAFYLNVGLQSNVSIEYCLLCSFCKYVVVASGRVSLYILPGWSDSIAVRSIQATVFFVTIFIGSVVKLDLCEIRKFAMFS